MSCHPDPAINAEVALDELRRERDEARAEAEKLRDFTVTGDELDRALDRAEAAEAQAARYRGALERLRALGCDEEVELEGEDSEFAAQTWLIADEALGGGDD